MKNQITLVSPPDDVLHDALRIMLVELDQEQTQLISEAFLTFESVPPTVLYVWKMGDSIEWLLDKKLKTDLIIFNAGASPNGAIELIIGYIAAQSNAYYLGNLKDLSKANPRAIYNIDSLKEILTRQFNKYEIQ
jgi:hypothetical protein